MQLRTKTEIIYRFLGFFQRLHSQKYYHTAEMGLFEPWWIMTVFIFMLMIPRIHVHGWGKEGHYVVCKIAENYLTEDALAAVKALLPDHAEGDLADVCSWADEIKFHYRWSSPLHYVDTPDFRCNYEYCRDCHDSHSRKDRCVTGAIYNYTMQLMPEHDDTYLSVAKYNLTEALMFLSHFVGDIHQPLHVSFTGDEGGNTIIVRWFRRKTNLHHTFYNNDLATLIQSIQNNITDAFVDVYSKENCKGTVCPDPYASESVSLACRFAYRNATPGITLQDDYFLSRLPVVEKRLAQSGVRLAALLNRIFSEHKSIASE